MRVLLVQSPTGRPEPRIFPLGLAFLAGALTDHRVSAVDLAAEADPEERLREVIASFRPDAVAVSLRNIDDSAYPSTHSYVLAFGRLMEWLEGYDGAVIAGGSGFSIYPGQILRDHPRIDIGVVGEAESALPRLLRRLERGDFPGRRLVEGERMAPERLPRPRYDLMDLSLYPMDYAVGVQSRRGCPFGCRYCTYGYLGGRRFRMRPVEEVVADVAELQRQGVTSFSFVDSVFNHPRDYMLDLVGALAKRGGTMRWSAWLDTDVPGEDLRLMARAGCDKVDFSPDALTARGLRLLGKRGGFRETVRAARLARSLGMFTTVNLFQGNPGEEGLWPLLLKLLFMVWTRLLLGAGSTVVHIGTIRVYAHSPMADDMAESGKVPKGCDFYRPVFHRSRRAADLLYRLFQRLRGIRHG
jgi:radical SAM superfamily enzyme YgiQ (UPF0313 family)